PCCCRPVASSTSSPLPKSMKIVTAGYGTTLRSKRSAVRTEKPAMLTPGSRTARDGVAMSSTAVRTGPESADRMKPGYETFIEHMAPGATTAMKAGRPEYLYKTPALTGGDCGLMTTSHRQPNATGCAAGTEESIVHLADGDIYVCQDGPPEAPAVLLIHGTASSARSWDLLVPMLARSHRVIRIDLLGHGRSAKPADG